MWPFKKKNKPAEGSPKVQSVEGTQKSTMNTERIFQDFLSGDEVKRREAMGYITGLVRNDASFGPDYEVEQMAITAKLLQLDNPLAKDVYLRFIEKHYIGAKLEPMIAYLVIRGHSDELIRLLAEDRIDTDVTRQNRDLLISNLVKFCVNSNNPSLALDLVKAFSKGDNEEEAVYGVGMERPFAEVLSRNGEEQLLEAFKNVNGYNQVELLCRALEDCGAEKSIKFLGSRNFPDYTRPRSTFSSREMAKVCTDRIHYRLSRK
jgi:hypothetical protein